MRSRTAVALILAVLLSSGCSPPGENPEERAERARTSARAALGRGDRVAALQAIGELRRSIPDTPEALLEVADLLVGAGDAPEAVWVLESAADPFSDHAELRLALARAALLAGNPSQAREAAQSVPTGSEQQAAALLVRAQAELQLGNLERALETLKEAQRLEPERPEARLLQVAALLSERRHDEARKAIEEARSSMSGEGAVEIRRRFDLALAQIQAAQGEHESALATLRQLVAQDPANVQAWRSLAQILAQKERGEEARSLEGIALARAALVDHPDSAALHQALGSLCFAAGLADEGDRAVDRALELDPDDPRPLRVRCEFRAATDRLAAARDDCTRYLEARPADAATYFTLGVVHAGLGESEHAEAAQADGVLTERETRLLEQGERMASFRQSLERSGGLRSLSEAPLRRGPLPPSE